MSKVSFKHTGIEPFYVGSALASFSGDGAVLVTAIEEDIVITDIIDNTTICKLEGDGEAVTIVQMSPDGQYVGVVSQSQQLRIYSVKEAKFIKNLKLSAPAFVGCCDPTSTLFAFGGSDGVVTVVDIENGYVTHSLKGHGSTISAIKFIGELNSADWKLLSGDTNGVIKVWDLVKRRALKTLAEHTNAVRGLDYCKQTGHYVSGGRDDIFIVWDERFRPVSTVSVGAQVEACGFLGDGHVYTGCGDGVFSVWSGSQRIGHSTKPIEELMIVGVLVTQDQRVWLNFSDQTLFQVADVGAQRLEFSRKLAGNHGVISEMRLVGPARNLLALATNSPGLRIVRRDRPYDVEILEGHTDLINCIDSSDDGLTIVTGAKDHEARVWRYSEALGTFEQHAVLRGHMGAVTAVALGDGFVVTGSADLTIKKWTITPGVVATSDYTRHAHDKDINALAVSPNDEFLATASFDKTAKVWDLESGEILGVLRGHKRGLWDVVFCPFDKTVLTCSGDKTIKQWSLAEFSCLKTYEGHLNSVQRVGFYNRMLVSTSADGLVKVWDYKTTECLKTYDEHVNKIWAMVGSPDGFVTADSDGYINFWTDNLDELKLQEEADKKLRVEQEQLLDNLMYSQDWLAAFKMAIKLGFALKIFTILDKLRELDDTEIDSVLLHLTNDEIEKLFRLIRNWNVNSKYFLNSQYLIKSFLKNGLLEQKVEEIPKLNGIVQGLIPYNERHYQRVNDLIERTFILDYVV